MLEKSHGVRSRSSEERHPRSIPSRRVVYLLSASRNGLLRKCSVLALKKVTRTVQATSGNPSQRRTRATVCPSAGGRRRQGGGWPAAATGRGFCGARERLGYLAVRISRPSFRAKPAEKRMSASPPRDTAQGKSVRGADSS